MHSFSPRNRSLFYALNTAPAMVPALILVVAMLAGAQAPPTPPTNSPAPDSAPTLHPRPIPTPDTRPPSEDRPLSEDGLRSRMQGKMFYLRGGYGDNDLRFDMHGTLEDNSPQVSHTLSVIQIDKVELSKHKLEIEGTRYGIHFLDNPANKQGSEKLRITPKKKVVKIIIKREEVPKLKKKKSKPPDQPTTVMTQAKANRILEEALKRIFSADIDQQMMASLPDYWQLYYRAAAARSPYKPSDPSVLRESMVDQKARLLTNFQTPSSDLAQKAGIYGIAQYHVVIGPDGQPGEIAVGRPIGFGLDEMAVANIRKALFQPAKKDGRPVPVLVDLVVQFRIYSNLTRAAANAGASATVSEPETPPLPGPYSASQSTKQP